MSQATERAVGIASKLYEFRRTARLLAGDEYSARVTKWMEAVQTMAPGGDVLTAARLMAESSAASGQDVHLLWIFAAAVELLEPDERTPRLEVCEETRAK